jgi:hypothetical protein
MSAECISLLTFCPFAYVFSLKLTTFVDANAEMQTILQRRSQKESPDCHIQAKLILLFLAEEA